MITLLVSDNEVLIQKVNISDIVVVRHDIYKFITNMDRKNIKYIIIDKDILMKLQISKQNILNIIIGIPIIIICANEECTMLYPTFTDSTSIPDRRKVNILDKLGRMSTDVIHTRNVQESLGKLDSIIFDIKTRVSNGKLTDSNVT